MTTSTSLNAGAPADRGVRRPGRLTLLLVLTLAASGCSLLVEASDCERDTDCLASEVCVEGRCLAVGDGAGVGDPDDGVGHDGVASESPAGSAGGTSPNHNVDTGGPGSAGENVGDGTPGDLEGAGGGAPGDGFGAGRDVDPPDPVAGAGGDGAPTPPEDSGDGRPAPSDGVEGAHGQDSCESVDGDDDGWSACDDCDDTDPEVPPGRREACDGRDTDCDGFVDNPCPSLRTGWPVRLPTNVAEHAAPTIGSVGGVSAVVVATHHGVHALTGAGAEIPGFPARTEDRFDSAPAIVELDCGAAEEGAEIVVADAGRRLHAIRPDGTSCQGWPVEVEAPIRGAMPIERLRPNHLLPSVLATDQDRRLHLVAGDGLRRRGRWPLALGGTPSGLAVADVDGDGARELIVSTEGAGLLLVAETGVVADGFPALADGPKLGPVAIDPGDPEVGAVAAIWVADQDGLVHRIDPFGRAYAGWPAGIGKKPTPPALADFDGDNRAEGVFGDQDGNVHVLDHTGAERRGWPVELPGKIVGSPAVADVGPSGGDVVFVATDRNELWALGQDGVVLAGWPVPTNGRVRGGAAVGDLDGNGNADIVAVTENGEVSAWELGPGSHRPETSDWPTARGGNARLGRWRR